MSYNVLVVDDEPVVLHVLQSYLRLRGFEVTTVADPQTALNMMSNARYHAAIVDINMPRMNGVQLLRRIRETAPHTQVMMMTAYSTIETALECLEAGATDYFLKPFRELADIAGIVQSACERVARWDNVTHHSPGN